MICLSFFGLEFFFEMSKKAWIISMYLLLVIGHVKSPRMGSKCETSQTTDFKSAGNDILSLIGGNGDTISNSNAEIKQKSSFKSLVPPPPTRVSCGSGSSTGGSLSSAGMFWWKVFWISFHVFKVCVIKGVLPPHHTTSFQSHKWRQTK